LAAFFLSSFSCKSYNASKLVRTHPYPISALVGNLEGSSGFLKSLSVLLEALKQQQCEYSEFYYLALVYEKQIHSRKHH